MIEGVQVDPAATDPRRAGDRLAHAQAHRSRTSASSARSTSRPIYQGVVKGWHRHERMALNYACIHGRIKLVLYDDRTGSPTRGELMEIFLGPDNYSLVVIPENVWNGFKGMAPESIVANCATRPTIR